MRRKRVAGIYILNHTIHFLAQVTSIPSHISIRALLTSHFWFPGKPGEENKHLWCQFHHEGEWDISVPCTSIEPSLLDWKSCHCDFGAQAIAVLYKGLTSLQGPHLVLSRPCGNRTDLQRYLSNHTVLIFLISHEICLFKILMFIAICNTYKSDKAF